MFCSFALSPSLRSSRVEDSRETAACSPVALPSCLATAVEFCEGMSLWREREDEKTTPRRSNAPLKDRASVDRWKSSRRPPPYDRIRVVFLVSRPLSPLAHDATNSSLGPLTPINPTRSTGKRHNKTHTLCRRCGRTTFHIQKSTCSSCGYPAARMRGCESKEFCLWC